MPRKTIGEKVDDLVITVTELQTEFKIFKRVGYIILAGTIGILAKLYWRAIIYSPTIVANVVAWVNTTSP